MRRYFERKYWWEFIICDDCSTDGTGDILAEYNEKYPDKFVVLKNDINRKLSYSLNRCLEVAQGEYIARMDGDDRSRDDRFEKQVRFLDEHPEYAFVGSLAIPFDSVSEKTDSPMYYYENPNIYVFVLWYAYHHPAMMVRKSAYDTVGGYTVCKRCDRGQDLDLWFKCLEKDLKGYNIQECLHYYRESVNTMKRRTLKTRYYASLTRVIGCRRCGYPFYFYILSFKPMLLYFVPDKLLLAVKEKIRKRKNLKKQNSDWI